MRNKDENTRVLIQQKSFNYLIDNLHQNYVRI